MKEHYVALALWVLFAHAHDAFGHSPILAVVGPTKRSGKTRVLEVLGNLVPNPLFASNATAAGVFRAIERDKPITLEIDEADTFLAHAAELRGILNSGFDRDGAVILRGDGRYSTWAPKAIALIGALAGPLRDRSITVHTQRKLPKQKVERFLRNDDAGLDLRREAARWAADHMDELSAADPEIPAELNDRQADAWRPLLAIADLLGGEWPRLAREAAVAMSKAAVDDDDDSAEVLVADLAKIFDDAQVDRMSSAMIVAKLKALSERPWAAYDHGRPFNELGLARILRNFGVKPKQWGEGPKAHRISVRGYYLSELAPIFARYLAQESGTPGTPGTPPLKDDEGAESEQSSPTKTGKSKHHHRKHRGK